MTQKEFVREYGKNLAKAIKCVKPWFGSGRLVILDAGFASVKCAQGLAENGLYMIGNVKMAHSDFPKAWLLSQVPQRGDRACAIATLKLANGQEWEMLAAADRDKQPMALLETAGASTMGEAMVRKYSTQRADGTIGTKDMTLEQWVIHSLYRKNFNWIDMHNAKRQGGTSFEETWKTKRWSVRDFQMLMGMSEVNVYLLWKSFKPGEAGCDPILFRRRLAWQLLHHPAWLKEKQENVQLRSAPDAKVHYLVKNPMKKMGLGRHERWTCRYCPRKTMWSCYCCHTVDGMPDDLKAGVTFVCNPSQSPQFFEKHSRGLSSKNKRAMAGTKAWVARKRVDLRRGGFK
jgi:hypothetical protein